MAPDRRTAGRQSNVGDLMLTRRLPFPLAFGLVGLDRLERSTSPLSGVRSNHLSYRPEALAQDCARRAPANGARCGDRAASPESVLVREERETETAGPANGFDQRRRSTLMF